MMGFAFNTIVRQNQQREIFFTTYGIEMLNTLNSLNKNGKLMKNVSSRNHIIECMCISTNSVSSGMFYDHVFQCIHRRRMITESQ